jgi:hypothetical protein
MGDAHIRASKLSPPSFGKASSKVGGCFGSAAAKRTDQAQGVRE